MNTDRLPPLRAPGENRDTHPDPAAGRPNADIRRDGLLELERPAGDDLL